jgi:hypothetical protein
MSLLSDSFMGGFNQGNDAFGAVCHESFVVEQKQSGSQNPGLAGTYQANLIDDLDSGEQGVAGGKLALNKVNIYLPKIVVDQAQIGQGSLLVVRGQRVRIKEVHDQGDNEYMLDCDKTGVSVKL